MRTKVTLVLVFLNVALFFFIFGLEREWRTDQQLMEARRRVLGPEASNIQTLEITGPALAQSIRIERAGDDWILTAPVQWPANPFAVSNIVSKLQVLEHETSFAVADLAANGQSLADYGLAEPALTVSFTPAPTPGADAAPAAINLAIGAETTVGNRLYVLSPDGSRVHVVDRSLAESLRISLDQLRSDRVFTIQFFEVRSLNLQTATPANLRVRLRRDGNRWAFEAPIVARADRAKTELTINGLNSLQTRKFLGSTADRPGLAEESGTSNPSLRVTLEGTNGRETLLLGREVGPVAGNASSPPGAAPASSPDLEYYARMEDRDAIFTVAIPAALLGDLRSAQESLRDRLVLDLQDRTVTGITLATPNLPDLTLQRLESASPATSARWQLVSRTPDGAPRTQPADREIVERLIQYLSVLRAEVFLRDAPSDADLEDWGLTRPARRITLTLAPQPGIAAGPTTLTLLLGVANEREGRVYAKLANQPYVYLVKPAILSATPVVAQSYRERLLRELPPGAKLTGITVTALADQTVLYQHTLADDETWPAVFAREPAARQAALTALRADLRTLRAKRFVFDQFRPTVPVAGEERPWAYRIDATLALSGGSAAQTTTSSLFLAERGGSETQLAGSPEFDVVFEAEQSLLDALWGLTYAPRDPGPPAAPVDVDTAFSTPPSPGLSPPEVPVAGNP